MKKLLFLLLMTLSGMAGTAQIKIPILPIVTSVAPNDYTIEQQHSGLPGTTKIITWTDLMNSLHLSTASGINHYLPIFISSGGMGNSFMFQGSNFVSMTVGKSFSEPDSIGTFEFLTGTHGGWGLYSHGKDESHPFIWIKRLEGTKVGNDSVNFFLSTSNGNELQSETQNILSAPSNIIPTGDSLVARGTLQFSNGNPKPGKFLAAIDTKGTAVWDSVASGSGIDTSALHGYGVTGQVAYYQTYNTISSSPDLFWDRPNHRLGILNNTPAVSLDVNGIVHSEDSLQIGDYAAIKSTSTIPFLFVPHYFGQPNSQIYFQIQDRLGDVRMRVNEGSCLIMGPGSGNDFYGNPANLYINGGQFTVYAEYALLNQSGNVGLWSNSNDGSIQFGSSVGSQGDVIFYTDNQTERMRIKGIVGNIGLGTSTPDPSSIVDEESTTQGHLIPRMTTIQKLAISSPAEGLEVYDLTLHQKSYYNGTTWVNY